MKYKLTFEGRTCEVIADNMHSAVLQSFEYVSEDRIYFIHNTGIWITPDKVAVFPLRRPGSKVDVRAVLVELIDAE